jgi:DNA-binding MarR family transcriptional regulator
MQEKHARHIWPMLSKTKDFQSELSDIYNVKLNDIDMAIFIYISAHQRVTIQKTRKTKYFRGYGVSTIKRSIVKLLNAEMISKVQDTIDRRKNILTVNWDL